MPCGYFLNGTSNLDIYGANQTNIYGRDSAQGNPKPSLVSWLLSNYTVVQKFRENNPVCMRGVNACAFAEFANEYVWGECAMVPYCVGYIIVWGTLIYLGPHLGTSLVSRYSAVLSIIFFGTYRYSQPEGACTHLSHGHTNFAIIIQFETKSNSSTNSHRQHHARRARLDDLHN